jgi:hypothetical protein
MTWLCETRLGVIPVGSLGVIVGAYHKGYMTLIEAEQHLVALYSVSSLFVTRTIVELVQNQATFSAIVMCDS